MKRTRFFVFVSSLLSGLLAGMSGQSVATDLEIYLGADPSAAGQVIRPNILFLLDSSGSMSTEVSSGGPSRLDEMKSALNQILDTTTNVNVGLMRFTDPGGPILYPVSPIDADVSSVEGAGGGGFDIQTRVADAADDAEENLVTNAVDLADVELTLGQVPDASAAPQTEDVRTLANNDDEEETVSGNPQSGGSFFDMNNNQINGVRFQLPNVPQGALIVDARLEWTARRDDSGDVTLTWHGHDVDSSPAFTGGFNDINNRVQTTAAVDWDPPAFVTDNSYQTSNLAPIVQEIVDRAGWTAGNYIGFIETHDGSSNSRSGFTHNGAGSNTSRRPRLIVNYVPPPFTPQNNMTGVRFQDVGIPQGATIESAFIEFVSRTNGTASTAEYLIEGELADDATAFAATASDISGRTPTAATVAWDEGANPWTAGQPYQTPDVTAIVQEMVNQPGWCGNNAMAFRITPQGATPINARVAHSHDSSASLAPVLRINYDESSVPAGGGCINQIFQYQVVDSRDDAEETISTTSVSTGGSSFDMRDSQINGLRFQGINLPQGSTILEANLTFVARSVDTGTATITWSGEAIDDAPMFSATNADISNRTLTTASVADTMAAWDTVGEQHRSADLSAVIQEIVGRSGWLAGNDLVLIQTATGQRRARTFNHAAGDAPRLRIKVQYGGQIIPTVVKPVRERLKEIVDDISADGYTPLVGQYYEAAQYYRGGPVFHGARRSHRFFQQAETRLSHPASYTGGTYDDPGNDCPPNNPNDPGCFDETITGSPEYISPFEFSCQANYIVMLSDGIANHNANEELQDHGVSLAQTLLSTAGMTCDSSVTSGEFCGRELAEFTNTVDQDPNLADPQTVITHTIGFDLAGLDSARTYLEEVAAAGGGSFYEATDAASLAAVFQAIIGDIIEQPTSLAAPALTVNAFNQLFNRNEVYFALFEPSYTARWAGNIKKYFVCDGTEFTGCTIPELLDADGLPAVGSNGQFLDTARSVWSAADDGADVEKGGAASNLPASPNRTVLTYTGLTAPANEALDVAAHRLPNDIDCSPEAIASDPPPTTCTSIVNDNTAITNAMLGLGATDNLGRVRLLNWITGQDVGDEDEDGDRSENRFGFGASLHASPVVITYGGTAADPVDKVFVASTNGLQMLNGKSGEEEWLFLPQAILAQQETARLNNTGDPIYGFDMTPTTWVNDTNDDGVIDPSLGEFARVFAAMRRGGQNIYAFDVTPASVVNDPDVNGLVTPTLMWRIEGGVTADFDNLGLTFSPPLFGNVLIDVAGTPTSTPALIFGGGHDDALDKDFTSSNIGNIIYIVDAVTGDLLTSIGGTATTAKLTVAGMDYPINTPISLRDVNGDGNVQRLYFGDEGGNIWRIDLKVFNASSTGGDVATVGQLADIALSAGATHGPLDDPTDADDNPERRRFFASTAAVPVRDTLFANETDYEYVLVQSGNRPDPLNEVIHNAFYAFRDYRLTALPDADNNGIADLDSPDADGWPNTPLTRAELFDVTPNPFQTEPDGTPVDQTIFDANLPALQSADGWFIDYKEDTAPTWIGEKGLTRPNVFFGNLFFTTYIPEPIDPSLNECQVSLGHSRLYGLNVLTGAALFADWDNPGSGTPSKDTRFQSLSGGGAASDPLIIISEGGTGGLAGSGAGGQEFPAGATLPIRRTYWFQQ